jgi:hypothetical protein
VRRSFSNKTRKIEAKIVSFVTNTRKIFACFSSKRNSKIMKRTKKNAKHHFYEKINVLGSETKNAKRNLALSFFRSGSETNFFLFKLSKKKVKMCPFFCLSTRKGSKTGLVLLQFVSKRIFLRNRHTLYRRLLSIYVA